MEPKIYCKFDALLPPQDIKPHPHNPNIHARTQAQRLAEIIKANGWREAVTISRLSGCLIKGHGRVEAAKTAGFTQIPVVFQDYATAADEAADLIADNRIAEESQLDYDAVSALVREFDLEAERLGAPENTGHLDDCYDAGSDSGEEKSRKIPVMILASEEEADAFDAVKARLGVKSDEKAFSAILKAYTEANNG